MAEKNQDPKNVDEKNLEVTELDDESLEGAAGGVGDQFATPLDQTNPGCTNNCNC